MYSSKCSLSNHGGAVPSDALYIMLIGGDDIREARNHLISAVERAFIDIGA